MTLQLKAWMKSSTQSFALKRIPKVFPTWPLRRLAPSRASGVATALLGALRFGTSNADTDTHSHACKYACAHGPAHQPTHPTDTFVFLFFSAGVARPPNPSVTHILRNATAIEGEWQRADKPARPLEPLCGLTLVASAPEFTIDIHTFTPSHTSTHPHAPLGRGLRHWRQHGEPGGAELRSAPEGGYLLRPCVAVLRASVGMLAAGKAKHEEDGGVPASWLLTAHLRRRRDPWSAMQLQVHVCMHILVRHAASQGVGGLPSSSLESEVPKPT